MSEGTICLRPWRDDDEPGMIALEKLVFGSPKVSPSDFFHWQYRTNPEGRAIIYVCEAPDGTVVGQYAVIPLPVRLSGHRFTASLSLNTATHPDYRRRGLFRKAATAVYDRLAEMGITLTVAIPNENSYPGFVGRLEFDDLGEPDVLHMVLDPRLFTAKMGISKKRAGSHRLGRTIMKSLRRTPRTTVPVTEAASFDGLALEKLVTHAKFAVAADRQWLNWRYVNNPSQNYRIAVAGDPGDPTGMIVWSVVDTAMGRKGYVMELMLSTGARGETVKSLVNYSLEAFDAEECMSVSCLAAPGSAKSSLLRHCGFWPLPRTLRPWPKRPKLMVRRHAGNVPSFSLEEVDVSFGLLDTL